MSIKDDMESKDEKIPIKKTKKRKFKMSLGIESKPEEPVERSDSQQVKKKKKKKRKPEENKAEQTSTKPEETNEEQPSKKKRKKGKDKKDHVHESAGQNKALRYLKSWEESQSSDQVPWKFEKCRQIWLLQHVYDEKKINDEYFDILLKYMCSIKGRMRETAKGRNIQS